MTELREDPLLSFIVPVYNIEQGIFKRCLESLVTQDYSNYEVVVVFDGKDEKLMPTMATYLKNYKNIRNIEIEHAGACAARNAGFKESKGEIVSFFNSDYVAKPGMAKMWVDLLLDNPEYGFAYGPYEWNSNHREVYWSKPFDEFELTQSNFIDCGFPVWRQHVVEWDSSVKSLQDWDFWIRVVKKGVKGYFISRDISFVAELPRPGGLSMDSHQNWAERVKYVRDKNDIPTSDLVVCSIGAPFHGAKMAQMIGADFDEGYLLVAKQHNYKSLYMVGFFMKPPDVKNLHADVMARFNDKTSLIHYIGADIYWLRKFTLEELKLLTGVLNKRCTRILCETELAQRELSEYGIKADIVPIPPYSDLKVEPLPKEFSCAIFLTGKSDFDKYCQKETLSIVRALPTINFNTYGDACYDTIYPNMKHYGNLGKQAWEKFVLGNSCYIRIARHDTRPMASDEFLLAGRDVITNIPGYGVTYIKTSGDIDRLEFDPFEIGLNDYYWPDTKKSIIKAIFEVKNNPKTEGARDLIHCELAKVLDKQKYKDIILSLSKPKDEEKLVEKGGEKNGKQAENLVCHPVER